MNPVEEGNRHQTVGVINEPGAGGFQSMEPIPHTRSVKILDFAIQQASAAVRQDDGRADFSVQEPINWIGISPSARNNEVHLSIGKDVLLTQLPPSTGNFYPLGEYQAKANQGTAQYRIPTIRNARISVFVSPTTGYALTNGAYNDRVAILYGYLPDEDEKVLLRE